MTLPTIPVLHGLTRTLDSCARLTAAGQSEQARDDATSAFLRLGSALGVPEVVLRQLVEDAEDYEAAHLTGAIVVEEPIATRLCSECHECPCLCPPEMVS
jgi:hypothetical protein